MSSKNSEFVSRGCTPTLKGNYANPGECSLLSSLVSPQGHCVRLDGDNILKELKERFRGRSNCSNIVWRPLNTPKLK